MKRSREFKAFDDLVGRLLTVSHEEIQRREAEYKKQMEARLVRRGPKPKVKLSASDHGKVSP
jgi:hypothetical protein